MRASTVCSGVSRVVAFAPHDLDGIISDAEAQSRSDLEPVCGAASIKLPERCRQVFLMSKRDGMTYSGDCR